MAIKATFTPRVHLRALHRLMAIHREVGAGKCPSVKSLAASLERSERTIKRDLRVMREDLGAPLYHDRSRGGWRYLEPGWSFPLMRLTEGELLAFFTAEHALRAMGHTPEAILLRGGLAKLSALLPEEVSFNMNFLGEAFTFHPVPHVLVEPHMLQTLARAAAERRTIEISYHSQHRNQLTTRDVNVLLLHNFASDWYAIAYDHFRREIRDFHIGRIRAIRMTQKYFEPPDDWNAKAYLQRGFFMTRGGRLTTVSIIFDAFQSRWIRERQTFHPDEVREELPGGELRLSFPVGVKGLEAVARFCLTYAGHCRAEKPAALRRLIRQRLTEALEQHRET